MCFSLLHKHGVKQAMLSSSFPVLSQHRAQGSPSWLNSSRGEQRTEEFPLSTLIQTSAGVTPLRAHTSLHLQARAASFSNSASLHVPDSSEELEAVVTEQCSSPQKSSPTHVCEK